MKAIVSVAHPDVVSLFKILTDVNVELEKTLAKFLHGDRDPIAAPEKELVWSIRSQHEPGYYRDDVEETLVEITVSICKRSPVVKFRADNIGGNNHEDAMVVASHYEFEMTRKNNRWIIQIGFDGRAHEFSIADAAKYLERELLKQK